MKEPKAGDMRVWHIPNPPREPYRQLVSSLDEAKLVLTTLSLYDLYLPRDIIHWNVQGLEVYEDHPDLERKDWYEWHEPETDDDIQAVMQREQEGLPLEGQAPSVMEKPPF